MPHDEEVLHSYEIGLKWSSQSFSVNAAAFYYDYQDYQAFTFEGLSSQIGNIDAEVTGAELEVAFAPTDRLELRLGASVQMLKLRIFKEHSSLIRLISNCLTRQITV